MRLPEFTAEASFDRLKKDYVLRSQSRGHSGDVLPQGLFVDRNGTSGTATTSSDAPRLDT